MNVSEEPAAPIFRVVQHQTPPKHLCVQEYRHYKTIHGIVHYYTSLPLYTRPRVTDDATQSYIQARQSKEGHLLNAPKLVSAEHINSTCDLLGQAHHSYYNFLDTYIFRTTHTHIRDFEYFFGNTHVSQTGNGFELRSTNAKILQAKFFIFY